MALLHARKGYNRRLIAWVLGYNSPLAHQPEGSGLKWESKQAELFGHSPKRRLRVDSGSRVVVWGVGTGSRGSGGWFRACCATGGWCCVPWVPSRRPRGSLRLWLVMVPSVPGGLVAEGGVPAEVLGGDEAGGEHAGRGEAHRAAVHGAVDAGDAVALGGAVDALDAVAERAVDVAPLLARVGELSSNDAAPLRHQTSRGLPRAVNKLALQALVATFAANKPSWMSQQPAPPSPKSPPTGRLDGRGPARLDQQNLQTVTSSHELTQRGWCARRLALLAVR